MSVSESQGISKKLSAQDIHDQLVSLRNEAISQQMDVSAHFIDVSIESVIRETKGFSWDRLEPSVDNDTVVSIG